jgi:solute carrier family 25 (adenine nucleotide translocator) protein 4/5/6/31
MSEASGVDTDGGAEVEAKTQAPTILSRLLVVEELALSGTAVAISKTLSAPLERVKLLVQCENEMLRKGTLHQPFNGVAGAFRQIAASEGLPAFWRSNLANCLYYLPTQALNFYFKEVIKDYGFKPSKSDGRRKALTKNIIGGGIAGVGSMCFGYSFDYARTRLSNDLVSNKLGGREFSGLRNVFQKTWASDGFVGFYRGFNISCLGVFVYRGLYFGLYDSAKSVMPKDTGAVKKYSVAYCVNVIAGIASYPIDTIRRRMMMSSGNKHLQYVNSWHASKVIYREGGVMAFMKGAGVNMVRGFAGAGILSGFDTFHEIYLSWRYPITLGPH